MRMFFLIFLCFASIFTNAQQTLDIAAPSQTGGNYGNISYVDVTTIGQKKIESFSYADVLGSPFWNDDWNTALLFLKKGVVKVQKAKLNLYTDEIHFVDKSETERAVDNTDVKKVIFFKGADTTKILAVFEALPDSMSTNKLSYYQVLNKGKMRLLVLKKTFVKENEYNPTTGKKDHSFYYKTTYALANNANIFPVKLNQSSILSVIPASADTEQWLKQNKNKLKNESEVVSFLDYYNSVIK